MPATKRKLRLAFVTTARSEYFQMRGLIRALQAQSEFEPLLLVGGAHLSPAHGMTVQAIEADNVPIAARLTTLSDGDRPQDIAESAARTVGLYAGALVNLDPDTVFILGDRYEHLAVALAARCLGLPIVHVHGGEISAGAQDDRFRHAITKLADLHFVTTEVYAARLRQMGEDASRVFVVGAPFVDLVAEVEPLSRKALEDALGRALLSPLALVAYHPATAGDELPAATMSVMLEAAAARCNAIVISSPNHDAGHRAIERVAQAFAEREPKASYHSHLGDQLFQSLLHHADVMVGNSSAGLHEAAYHRLPVVDVGARQAGRLAARHVLRCGTETSEISGAIESALQPHFRGALPAWPEPFGSRHVDERMIAVLRAHAHDLRANAGKPFVDFDEVTSAARSWMAVHG